MTETPTEGRGLRELDCDRYKACLDFAAKKNWESFHCGKCTYQRGEGVTPVSKDEPTAPDLCKDCGEKERMGNSPYCARCMAIRGNKARAKDKDADKPRKRKDTTKTKPKPEKALEEATTALRIEFGKHVAILREIETLADKEIRPVECQIIYMLKRQLIREKEVQTS